MWVIFMMMLTGHVGVTEGHRLCLLIRSYPDLWSLNLLVFPKNSLLNINVTESIENIDTADLRGNIRDKNKFSARGGIEFDLDRGHFKANSLDADRDAGLLKIDGDVEITNSESRLTADSFFLQRSPMQEITDRPPQTV